jgi:hypothetical protein
MAILFFILSVIGLVLLIVCICKFVAPYRGWNCVFGSSVEQMTVDIAKADRYSINIRRDSFWIFKGHGNLSDAPHFSQPGFSIKSLSTGENMHYYSAHSFFRSTGSGTVTIRVGYFDAPDSGQYLITRNPGSRVLQNEEIVIRKYVSTITQVLLILGIIGSSYMFLGSLGFGVLKLTGNI